MGLFDIFKRWNTPKIPREIFVQDLTDDEIQINKTENGMEYMTSKISEMQYRYGRVNCREDLDAFLERNFDQEGYEAALVNADSSNMKSHTEILKLELEKIVQKCLALYEDENRYYEADIKIHTNLGIMDTVERLNVGKINNVEAINRIRTIHTESLSGTGIGCLPILSFEQGFKRGVSSRLFL